MIGGHSFFSRREVADGPQERRGVVAKGYALQFEFINAAIAKGVEILTKQLTHRLLLIEVGKDFGKRRLLEQTHRFLIATDTGGQFRHPPCRFGTDDFSAAAHQIVLQGAV